MTKNCTHMCSSTANIAFLLRSIVCKLGPIWPDFLWSMLMLYKTMFFFLICTCFFSDVILFLNLIFFVLFIFDFAWMSDKVAWHQICHDLYGLQNIMFVFANYFIFYPILMGIITSSEPNVRSRPRYSTI